MTSFLRFDLRPLPPKRKTNIYDVVNVKTGETLAVIGFFPAWRKYVCEAHPGMVFDANCYREIADFLDTLTTQWRMDQL